MRKTAVIVAAMAMLVAFTGRSAAAVVTNSSEDLRTGWYPDQPSITPGLVAEKGGFGRLWSAHVEGQVYAQPLVADETLLVATEKNWVYGFNPVSGARDWSVQLPHSAPWEVEKELPGCNDLAPYVGVTSTPVIDTATETAYLTHKSYDEHGEPAWYMDAIDVRTGVERSGFPVQLSGESEVAPGDDFSPKYQLQRPGLLLMEGVVYAAFGSDCDFAHWQGWVFGVSTGEHKITARWTSEPNGETGGGIWQAGAGLTSDGEKTILLSTGNGPTPEARTPGTSPPATLGESVVRLRVQPGGGLRASEFFTPSEAKKLGEEDMDFASGGVTGLPSEWFGTPSHPDLALAVGKSGYAYLMDRNALGGFDEGAPGPPLEGDKALQRVWVGGGVWSRAGVWPGEGGWVYVPTASDGKNAGGSYGRLSVLRYSTPGGAPSLALAGESSGTFGFSSSAPVITSNATEAGSAVVWIVHTEQEKGWEGKNAELRAYSAGSAAPSELWHERIGTSSKFATPGVGEGRLYIGGREGQILAFGPLHEESANEREAREQKESEAREQKELEAREQKERETREREQREREASELGEREAVEHAEAEAKERQGREARERARLEAEHAAAPPAPAPLTPTVGQQSILSTRESTPPVPAVQLLGSRQLRVGRSGTVVVELACPIAVTRCVGSFTLRSLHGVLVSAAANGRRRWAHPVLARTSFALGAGRVAAVTLRLYPSALTGLRRRGVLAAGADIDALDPAGTAHVTRAEVTLRARAA